jgi:hypothetical protein
MNETMVENLANRFWPKVEKGSNCWNWSGTKHDRGYGALRVGKLMKKATHVSVFLHSGTWPEAGKVVCHSCDNPACVRPDHLFIGTTLDNNRDRHLKGRTVFNICAPEKKARGERHGLAKLNAENVTEIRSMPGSQREIAALFGVSQHTVKCVLQRKTWKHV